MSDVAKWLRNQAGEERVGRYMIKYGEYAALADLAAQQHTLLEGYEDWEARLIETWGNGPDPVLSQELQDGLIELQGKRTATMKATEDFQEQYECV